MEILFSDDLLMVYHTSKTLFPFQHLLFKISSKKLLSTMPHLLWKLSRNLLLNLLPQHILVFNIFLRDALSHILKQSTSTSALGLGK